VNTCTLEKKEVLEEVLDFKIEGKDYFYREGQITRAVEYAGDLVLLVKEKQRYKCLIT
jgi:hypothetical protein